MSKTKGQKECIHYWEIVSTWHVMNEIMVRRQCKNCKNRQDGFMKVTEIKNWSNSPVYILSE